ncbi:MAG: endonuclease MutS2 [bacterium]
MSDPAELYDLLEFNKILQLLSRFVMSDFAKTHIEEIHFVRDKKTIEILLTEVTELRDLIEHDEPFPLDSYDDIRHDLNAAAVPGHFLQPAALVRVIRVLSVAAKVRAYLSKRRKSSPLLWVHAEKITELKHIQREVQRNIDLKTLEVKDSASDRLSQLRKAISHAEQNVRAVVEKALKTYSAKGYLQESLMTFRDGRFVLPLKLDYKGQVKGLVIDESASGATLFIEPFESVEINNKIRRLKIEERREIERILQELTARLRPEIENIRHNLMALSQLDFIQAKALFARELNCSQPALNDHNLIHIREGRHPLLVMRDHGGEKVVPLNLKIGDGFHTLVITGPNAGGKTVALKTIGLFCLMVQTGIPVPVSPDSQMAVFETVFADIGDFQSIEQDLSTFTSHMQKMKTILQSAGSKSLVLVDEIGVGTDPEEGSAIAVAFLEELNRRHVISIVTTHHGALKEFAYNTGGVENGCMDFDVETLQPTYRFRVGIPGSSYAIEIAKRSGISEPVLARCRELVGAEKGKLENLIGELERHVSESEKLTEKMNVEKTRQQGLAKLYKERYEKLKRYEKSLKAKAAAEADEILQLANARIERAVKEIKEGHASQEAIKRAKKTVADEKAKIAVARAEINADEPEPDLAPLQKVDLGEHVYWRRQNSHGKVISGVDGAGKVLIEVDNFKFRVPLGELQLSTMPEEPQRQKRRTSVKIETSPKSDVLPEISLRGQSLEEAIANTDKFLDDALLAGWQTVRIIHGKGAGILRKGIADFLKSHPRVKSKKMGAWNEGDIGVTVVELD